MRLAIEDHTGSYMNIGGAFERLFGRIAALGLLGPGTRMIGVYLDDPSAIAEEKLRSQAGLLVEGPVPATLRTPRSSAAIMSCCATRARTPTCAPPYRWLFGTWLPQSGREPADGPVLEEYFNSPRDTAPADLLTDLYLPIR